MPSEAGSGEAGVALSVKEVEGGPGKVLRCLSAQLRVGV